MLIENVDEEADKVKVIHYSGRRKPWGPIWDGDDNNKNCVRYATLMNENNAVKIWYKYYDDDIQPYDEKFKFKTFEITTKLSDDKIALQIKNEFKDHFEILEDEYNELINIVSFIFVILSILFVIMKLLFIISLVL